MTVPVDIMPTTHIPTLQARRVILPRWLGIVFPVVIVAAMGFAGVHRLNRVILPLALSLATTTGLGLVAGFIVRWTMRERPGVMRGLTSLAALTVGLLTLGLITQGQAGLGPFDPESTAPNWAGLGHLALASLAAWLALLAWRPQGAGLGLADRWRALRARARARWVESALHRQITQVRDWLGQTSARVSAHQSLSSSPTSRRQVRINTPRPRPGWHVLERIKGILTGPEGHVLRRGVRPGRSRYSRGIRFTGVEEHRCPYCLELVDPHDPRGVQVCPICHTPHHADCWAVTGMCQVAHHHTESH